MSNPKRGVQVFKTVREVPPGGTHSVSRRVDAGGAVFHQFGVDFEEFESGPAPFSVAIIERPDGAVEMVRADMIRFTE